MAGTSRRKPTIVPGFKFAGISSGIKKKGEKDLALIFSEIPANTAGVFTVNKIKAAPVKLALDKLSSDKKAQAIIVNSGNANACTGKQGVRDAEDIVNSAASALGISPGFVFVSSTGVIGRPLPVQKIKKALPALAGSLSPASIKNAATAIMTTDTFPKIASKQIKIGGKTGTIAGIAKGAGMICPNMATMLSFIVTDIAISPGDLDAALKDAVNKSFNSLIVDNDMSTNDSVIIMANGALGNRPVSKRSRFYQGIKNALCDITKDLALMIAGDGEGATKLIEVTVKGAGTGSDAEKVARAVAGSMLVKTAVYGKDPNWGRIIAAVGYSGAEINEEKIDIYLGKVKLVSRGTGTGKEKSAAGFLGGKKIVITIDLGSGSRSARCVTCDLTEDYIKINAHYTT